ncbi:acyltransferase domain-containing protein [Mycobacterium koreense]|uniref:Polyketide synthase n=1 Tax=Mycolicibacillus koreensis TaxID=1069220 RepID=A0A7I7SDP4_9MYCO|nr:type I polyketide synthase [Mycolicibacillus koreensis]MCV7246735.1 acyltransferase domain-containing protein [Mycolicibacillus koreensis]OSC32166.1 polyketide synthase [Mycolicibacillus koreensis]BBY54399.1 phthiocerol/phenolphthiocerol synthesis polyketide synthase type I PpsE [Mycolicibacillus koreensis]
MSTPTDTELPTTAIAVIGMAGRFPGADSLATFWANLRGGVESIVDLSADELRAAGIAEATLDNHSYVRRAALLDGIEEFDAEFFGFTPHTAATLDPQHRLFLQTAWHAFEDAGVNPATLQASVGVFGTSSASGYLLHNLMSHHRPSTVIGEGATFEMVNLSLHNDKDHLATRVAHQFNLRGPALSVQTACSSSLVAVHLACQALLNGECEMALAGGSSIRVPHRVGYWHEAGSMVSGTGHCRPFDVRSDGTIFGSGVGAVLLKPLADAIADGDRVHAVIRGSAINNDGATKMNYAAPNAVGQAEVIAEAHAVAEIDPASVGYIETHGTGTPLGDPIELDGLRQAFAISEEERPGPCYLGSVKSNIGHLEVASGIAGLIKAILCLEHREIPATLHYTAPNPELHLDRGPFEVRDQHGAWEWPGVRRAGVSSFGVGGTNAHVVLEEAPDRPAPSENTSGAQVLVMSARTPESLQDYRGALAAELSADAPDLVDVAATLAGRRTEKVRGVVVAHDPVQAASVLVADDHDNALVADAPDPGVTGLDERVVFMFPGQGAQHIGMARGLYDAEPVFAEHFDACAAAFGDELDIDLRAEIFDGTARSLERTDRTQPALFTVQYALARLLQSYGVQPAAMAGHSIGEYTAATLAGVFDLSTAVQAVAMRARLMHAAPRGVMVAVPCSADQITEDLAATAVDLATVNDPGSCVVAGTAETIAAFTERLAERGITARRVRTSHGFHSRLMDPVVPEFATYLSQLALHEPRIPLLSNITGTWLTADAATDPQTWAKQIRSTVRFADELDVLLGHPGRVLIEVGPGGSLTGSAMRHPAFSGDHRAVRMMRHHAQNRDDHDTFLLGLGALWAAGVDVDWRPRHGGRTPTRVTVPGYPFDRQRHWIDYAGGHGQAPLPVAARAAMTAGNGSGGDVDPTAQMEATVQRIWGQCLGINDIGRGANFFDIGGDSLIAISVAMTATHEGLDLTPQDLYEHPTVSALARALVARYSEGGLARDPGTAAAPPLPPNLERFIDAGLADRGRWRIPLLLRLRPDVDADDIHAALTAVINHHEALRLQLVQRGGTWVQEIGEPQEFTDFTTRELPDHGDEHQAVLTLLAEQIGAEDLAPLTATHIRGRTGGPCYLALSLHAMVADPASRDIVLADVLTALGQRIGGQDITLPTVPVSWRQWATRCAALSTHPSVLDTADYWLRAGTSATLQIGEPTVDTAPHVGDLNRHSSVLSVADTTELDDARRRCKVSVDDIVLAALAETIATCSGEGTLAVDLGGLGRSVLKPDVDLHRTVGWFTTVYPVVLECSANPARSAAERIDAVHETVSTVPHYGIGYGLLRYVYAPTARTLAAQPTAQIYLHNAGTIPELPSLSTDDAPVQFDPDTALPVRDTVPGLGHAIELRLYRLAGQLHLDWWHDTRRIDADATQRLAVTLAEAVMRLARTVIDEDSGDASDDRSDGDADLADGDLTLVDLSSQT